MSDLDFQEALGAIGQLASKAGRAVIVTHDNPDPDGMAAAAGLAFFLAERHGLETRFAYGGIVGRAENQAMVRLLKMPRGSLARVRFRDDDLVCMVDVQPGQGNHSLPEEIKAAVVVDHHPIRPDEAVPVPLLSTRYGATSSIITAFLRASGIEPPPELATALYYGVKTDTRSLSREADEEDREAYRWLRPRSDPALLSEIEHPVVPRRWFEAYHRAYSRARVFGDVVVADIGDVYVPDIVPEIAERLMALEGMKWSVAFGVYEGLMYVSVRTNDGRMNAGKRLQASLGDIPDTSAGGHGRMAGARMDLTGVPYREARQRIKDAIVRVKEALHASSEGRPLIDPMEALADARR